MQTGSQTFAAGSGNVRSRDLWTEHPALEHLASLIPMEFPDEKAATEFCETIQITPSLERVLSELTAVLHQSRARHPILTGAKGCGRTTMLKLLAARIAGGQVPGFSEYRVVYLDTANVGVEDSRAMLESLFAGLRDNSNVVVLIDNLGQLLQRSGGTNKPLIRSISSRREEVYKGTFCFNRSVHVPFDISIASF